MITQDRRSRLEFICELHGQNNREGSIYVMRNYLNSIFPRRTAAFQAADLQRRELRSNFERKSGSLKT